MGETTPTPVTTTLLLKIFSPPYAGTGESGPSQERNKLGIAGHINYSCF